MGAWAIVWGRRGDGGGGQLLRMQPGHVSSVSRRTEWGVCFSDVLMAVVGLQFFFFGCQHHGEVVQRACQMSARSMRGGKKRR